MRLIKTWKLLRDRLSDADCLWIKSNADNVTVDYHTNFVNTYGREVSYVTSPADIYIFTSTEQQEAMLNLKFDRDLILMKVEHYESNYCVLW